MKVLHINTFQNGGAACAVKNLVIALNSASLNTKILYLHKTLEDDMNSYAYNTQGDEKIGFIEKENVNFLNSQKTKHNFCGMIDSDAFSFPKTSYKKLTENKYVVEADIVHLHWVAKFIDYETFFYKINKPIVWTFHDSNPFDGFFHFVGDDKKNPWLKELLLYYTKIKSKAFSNSNIHVVTPSKWLMNRFKKTGFSHSSSHVINNTIANPIKLLKKNSTKFPKTNNYINVFFYSWDLSTKCKRFNFYERLSKKFSTEKINFYCVGEKNGVIIPRSIKWLGSNKSTNDIYKILSEMDVTIVCSENDNFPNAVLESLNVGTPVIGMPSGGVPELINNDTGLISYENTFESLCSTFEIYTKCSNDFNRNKVKEISRKQFSSLRQAHSYIKLYKSILNEK